MKLAVLFLIVASPAFADVPKDAPTETDVDRADTPVGRTEFGFDGGAPIASAGGDASAGGFDGGWGVTLASGWLEQPITARLADGSRVEPVHRRETFTLGGALALGDSVVIDARWSAAHQIGDRLRGTGDERTLDRVVPSDLRIGARLRVFQGDAVAAFFRADLALPTGDQQDFAGDAGTSVAWRLIGRATLPAGIVAAATVGLRLRGTEVQLGDKVVIGNEGLGALGIAVPIPPIRPLWCVREQVRLTGELVGIVGDDVGAAGRGPSPVEARLGLVTQPLPSLTLGFRIGAGLNDDIGAPKLRATVEVTYRGSWKLIEPAEREDDE